MRSDVGAHRQREATATLVYHLDNQGFHSLSTEVWDISIALILLEEKTSQLSDEVSISLENTPEDEFGVFDCITEMRDLALQTQKLSALYYEAMLQVADLAPLTYAKFHKEVLKGHLEMLQASGLLED